ncbi:MAG: hypothetical protein K0S65_3765 [Labilithrix sp.]|nr:hypothetical protein [Labilithrix sp.]
MAMRLSEIHPATVHLPLALLPIATLADAIGTVTNHRKLLDVGKWAIVGAAVSGAVAAAFGLIAQEEVSLDEQGKRVLATHRTLNVGLLGALAMMAIVRATRRRPSIGQLFAGLGALSLAGLSAYLGGKLVYDHGAGVKRVGAASTDLELTPRNTLAAARRAATDIARGVAHAAADLKRGELVPALVGTRRA